MKRIAILGCENSHANKFLNFIRDKAEFGDVEVVGVYSDDIEAAKKLNANYGVPVLENYTDALGKIDGLVITARHGDNHFKYAKPYIESGIPMFIDKPITIKEDEAIEMAKLLKKNNVRVSGGSCLKYDHCIKELKKDANYEIGGKTISGFVRAPYIKENDYGNFYFYAQHLVEMVCEIYGRYPISVLARENGNQIHVLWHYEEYDCVSVFCNDNMEYYASRMAETATKSLDINMSDDLFYEEFNEYYSLLCGAKQTCTYKEFIFPVFIMNAIARSLESGKEEKVNTVDNI